MENYEVIHCKLAGKCTIRCLFVALSICGVAASVASANDGYTDIGYGTKSRGMGGAGIAFPQDALAVATNPAGEAWVGNRLDLDGIYDKPRRGITEGITGDMVRDGGNEREDFFFGEGGAIWHVSDRFTLGFAMYHNGGVDSSYNSPTFGQFGLDFQQYFLAPSLSFSISPDQAIGIAPLYAIERFRAFGANIADGAGQTEHNEGLGVRVGYIGRFFEHVTLGLAWQSRISMGRFRYHPYEEFAEPRHFDIPSNFAGGLGFRHRFECNFCFGC